MNTKTCMRCKKLFSYVYGPVLCRACVEQDDEDFKRVKEFLWENKGASVNYVAEQLEISANKINRFLREGRLDEFKSDLGVICKRCGKVTTKGRLCEKCLAATQSEIAGAKKDMQPERPLPTSKDSRAKMHIDFINK